MTDRIKTLVVHLEDDVRDDDAEVIATAIRCLRRVTRVEPVIAEYEDQWALEEAKRQLREEMRSVLWPPR